MNNIVENVIEEKIEEIAENRKNNNVEEVDIVVEPVTTSIEFENNKKITEETEFVEIVDKEGTYHICRMVFGMIFPNTPPEIPDENIRSFANELYIYCEMKGINIRDFLFDEIGLVATLVPIASIIMQKYTNYRQRKRQERYNLEKGGKENASTESD